MPTWVVMAVYLAGELHLSPLQLVLMGTAMEAAVFLFEIPTGVVADTYSRRLSLIIGYLGMGAAWLAVGLSRASSVSSSPGTWRVVAGGPVLGAVGNVWGIRAALAAGGLVIAPALALYARAIRHEGGEPELGELPFPAVVD